MSHLPWSPGPQDSGAVQHCPECVETTKCPPADELTNSRCCLVAQSCPTLFSPMDCSPPGFSVHAVSQARVLERVAIPFSRGVFPDSYVGKESACHAGDPGSIPGSGRSPGEGTGYPLQYSWASLVAQLVKNLPAMQETWFRSLCREDPLEKGKATHSSLLTWRIAWIVYSIGLQRVRHE